jgi:Sortase domain
MADDRKILGAFGAARAALVAGGLVILIAATACVGPFSDDDDDEGGATISTVEEEEGDEATPEEGEGDDEGETPPSDAPIQRIIVEGADIDNSSIITLSLQDDLRTFEVPTNATQVAWYDFSGLPGEEGKSPIMAAHVDYKGQKGPFYTLTEAGADSAIYLVMADGTIYEYRVVTNRDIAKATLSWEDVGCDFNQCYAPDAITLITCGGNFNPRTRSYNDNVVVRAELVGEIDESELPA